MRATILCIFCVLLGLLSAALATPPTHLSNGDISALYGTWETFIGNNAIRRTMAITARTITVDRKCAIPYKVLGVKLMKNGDYIVGIREDKSAVFGAPMVGMPDCISDGRPFIVWQVFRPPNGLGMSSWSSYDHLKEFVESLRSKAPGPVEQTYGYSTWLRVRRK